MEDIEFDQDDPIEIRQLRLEHAINRRMGERQHWIVGVPQRGSTHLLLRV